MHQCRLKPGGGPVGAHRAADVGGPIACGAGPGEALGPQGQRPWGSGHGPVPRSGPSSPPRPDEDQGAGCRPGLCRRLLGLPQGHGRGHTRPRHPPRLLRLRRGTTAASATPVTEMARSSAAPGQVPPWPAPPPPAAARAAGPPPPRDCPRPAQPATPGHAGPRDRAWPWRSPTGSGARTQPTRRAPAAPVPTRRGRRWRPAGPGGWLSAGPGWAGTVGDRRHPAQRPAVAGRRRQLTGWSDHLRVLRVLQMLRITADPLYPGS